MAEKGLTVEEVDDDEAAFEREFRPVNPEAKVRRAFSVKKLSGKVVHTIFMRSPKNGKLIAREIEEPAGYMVTFLKGHSLRARNVQALKDMGITAMVPLINTETGDTVEHVPL